VVWAPEFWEYPRWAQACDLMFADAAGWDRPIRFVGNVGGHAAAWTGLSDTTATPLSRADGGHDRRARAPPHRSEPVSARSARRKAAFAGALASASLLKKA